MRALSSSSEPAGTDDPVTRLDARTKVAILLVCSLTVTFLKDLLPLSILAGAGFFYLVPLRRFRVMCIAYAALGLMALLALGFVKLMGLMAPEEMAGFELSRFLVPFLRLTVLMEVVLVLALSSRIQDILNTLRSLRLPLFLYLPAVVTVRFIPSFLHDIRQIHESLKIRGYSLNPVFLGLHPLLSFRLLFFPLVIRALRSAEDLAIAAELKGLGSSETVSVYRTARMGGADYGALAVTLVLVAVSGLVSFLPPSSAGGPV